MTREEFEHAIRAACDIADDEAVFVFGSQAILGQFPDAPPGLRQSVEVDVTPVRNVGRVDAINAAIGELSQFHNTFGFYVHGLPIEESAKLPRGWRRRVIEVSEHMLGKKGLCLEAHDLAASKLAAFRDKDQDFVRVLLQERLISPGTLAARVRTLPIDEALRSRCHQWVSVTSQSMPVRKSTHARRTKKR